MTAKLGGSSLANAVLGLCLGLGLAACAGGSDGEIAADSANVTSADGITLANWQGHPRIKAVRDEVSAIDAIGLKVEAKKMCGDDVVGESLRQKGLDATGKIRTLILQGGSDDSASTDRYYYDAAGKPRFLFQTRNDVHGNASERRVYFDETGAKIWDVEKHASDPDNGKPDLTKAPFVIPDAPTDVHPGVADPAAIFASPAECG